MLCRSHIKTHLAQNPIFLLRSSPSISDQCDQASGLWASSQWDDLLDGDGQRWGQPSPQQHRPRHGGGDCKYNPAKYTHFQMWRLSAAAVTEPFFPLTSLFCAEQPMDFTLYWWKSTTSCYLMFKVIVMGPTSASPVQLQFYHRGHWVQTSLTKA